MGGGGRSRNELKKQAQRVGLGHRIRFTGAVPADQGARYLAATDGAVATLPDTPQARTKSPLKVVEYMAAGKAMLSSLDEPTLTHYFAESFRPLFTPRTLTDEVTLRDQIAAVRDTGFAFTDEEYTLGVCGIARVVRIDGVAAGALAVALPKLRYTPDARAQIMDRLTAACAAIDAGA